MIAVNCNGRAHPPSHRLPKDMRTQAGDRLRVQVVDNCSIAADHLAELVQRWDNEVCVSRSLAGALPDALVFRPDVALIDLENDESGGCELAVRLRAEATLGHLVLIAQAPVGDEASRSRTSTAGFFLHLVKPVNADILRMILAGLAKRKSITM